MLRFLIVISITYAAIFTASVLAAPKDAVVEELSALKSQNHLAMQRIDQQITKYLDEGAEIDPVRKLRERKRELLLRQDFLDRLLVRVNSRFKGGDLQKFLHVNLLDLAKNEALSASQEPSLWKFLNYMAIAIRDLPEKNEKLVRFIEGYMKFSTISSPIRPEEFQLRRNYTNGSESQIAAPVSSERVGEVVGDKLREIEAMNHYQSQTFEQTRPVLKPVTQTMLPQPQPYVENTRKARVKSNQVLRELGEHLDSEIEPIDPERPE